MPDSTATDGLNGSKKVSRFTEKPTVSVAEELLKEGAFWNGGVFAFRLGYMMDIVSKYIQSDSFEDIRSRYSEFPKISFDTKLPKKQSLLQWFRSLESGKTLALGTL